MARGAGGTHADQAVNKDARCRGREDLTSFRVAKTSPSAEFIYKLRPRQQEAVRCAHPEGRGFQVKGVSEPAMSSVARQKKGQVARVAGRTGEGAVTGTTALATRRWQLEPGAGRGDGEERMV